MMIVIPDYVTAVFCLLLIGWCLFLVWKLGRSEQRVADAQMEAALKDQQVRALQTMNAAGVVEMTSYLNNEYRN